MPKPYLLAGIDIGNSEVKVVIAQVQPDSKPEILGVGTAPSHGLRRGMVVDMEETIHDVGAAVQRAEAMAGVKIKRAYVGVNGLHIKNQISRGVIAVSRADNEICQSDIDRVLQAASVVSLPANREIIHVVPRNFIIDGSENVKNPLGMKGVRLEAEVLIIDGLSPYIRNVVKCVNENGLEAAGIVFAPLAASLSVLDKNQREYGVMHLDFGGGTSTLTVFHEADLMHSAVLPIGSRHITNDLAMALRTSMDVAERIKLEHAATATGEDLRKRETLDLSAIMGEQNFLLPRKQLTRVVDARVEEFIDLITGELKKIPRSGMLPAGVVVSGGGAQLPGLLGVIKDTLRLPVRLARPLHLDGVNDLAAGPAFAVATGLILWGYESEMTPDKSRGHLTSSVGDGALGKIADWFKNFLP